MGEEKKKLKPLDYKELYRNKIKQGTWYIDEIFKLKEENKLLKSKLEKVKEAFNDINMLLKTVSDDDFEKDGSMSVRMSNEKWLRLKTALKEIEGLE